MACVTGATARGCVAGSKTSKLFLFTRQTALFSPSWNSSGVERVTDLHTTRESGMDLSTWLHSLGLGQYEQAFRENAVEPDVLLRLTAEDLRELGVLPVGHRRKLLDAIAALRVSVSPTSDDAREATS